MLREKLPINEKTKRYLDLVGRDGKSLSSSKQRRKSQVNTKVRREAAP